MEWKILFKKVKPSELLENYISEKITRECRKFSLDIIQVTVVLSQSGRDYTATCNLVGGQSLKLHMEGKGEETHAAIDNMVHKLNLSLKKNKDRFTEHKHTSRGGFSQLKQNPPESVDQDWDSVPMDADDVLALEKRKNSKKKLA